MMRGFNWTPARDRQLRTLLHEGHTLAWIAGEIRCDVEHVQMRAAELREHARKSMPQTTAVPRPVAVRRPGLIDLSKAPSAMERRFGKVSS